MFIILSILKLCYKEDFETAISHQSPCLREVLLPGTAAMEIPGVAPAMAFVATAAAVAVARSTTAAVANHVDEVSYKAAFYTTPLGSINT